MSRKPHHATGANYGVPRMWNFFLSWDPSEPKGVDRGRTGGFIAVKAYKGFNWRGN